jgi:uncharacterized membrane protein
MDEQEKHREQLYLELRKGLEDRRFENQGYFDKTKLTLSTAALGFSVVVVKDLPFLNNNFSLLMIIAWVALVTSCILLLFSYHYSSKAFKKQIKIVDLWYSKGIEPGTQKNRFDKITKKLNFYSSIAFIIGIILILLYVALNLK